MVSAVLIGAVVASPSSVVTRALEARPLRTVGVLSYSLYLWHWPVFLFLTAGRTSLSGYALLGVRLVVTFALATTAYHLVEAPLRRSAWRPRRMVALPLGATALACGLALLAWSAVPRPGLLSATAPAVADKHQQRDESTGQTDAPERSRTPTSLRSASAVPDDEDAPHRLRVTLLGDSTALTLGDGLRDVAGLDGVNFYNASTRGCGVTTAFPYRYMGEVNPYARTQCHTWESRWRKRVFARPTDVVAILVGRWEVADQVVDGTWTHVGTPRFDAYIRGELQKAVAAASSAGAPVVFLTAPYCSRGEQPDGSPWPEDDPARVDAFNRILRSVAAQQPERVTVVELGRRTSAGDHRYVNVVDGVVLRYDGVHFTPAAAGWIQPWLRRQLERAAARL
jgi:hypothetical protein